MRTKRSATLALILLFSTRLSAIEWEYINATFLLGVHNNALIGSEADALEPSPVLFSPGASVFSYFGTESNSIYIQPGLQLYWTIQEVKDNIPQLVGPESIAHMQVLNMSFDFPFGYLFNIGELRLGVQVGGVLDLSIPLLKAQKGEAEPEAFWKAHYETLRFVKLSLGSWVEFPVSESNKVALGFGMVYPLANFWTQAPLDHGMRFNLTVSIPVSLQK